MSLIKKLYSTPQGRSRSVAALFAGLFVTGLLTLAGSVLESRLSFAAVTFTVVLVLLALDLCATEEAINDALESEANADFYSRCCQAERNRYADLVSLVTFGEISLDSTPDEVATRVDHNTNVLSEMIAGEWVLAAWELANAVDAAVVTGQPIAAETVELAQDIVANGVPDLLDA
jgi:hypothetical protein